MLHNWYRNITALFAFIPDNNKHIKKYIHKSCFQLYLVQNYVTGMAAKNVHLIVQNLFPLDFLL
jgi:hypothetical protein